MKTMSALKQLVGSKVRAGKSSAGYSEEELEKLCKENGYAHCQVREPGYMYDCVYDDSRVQVHVDDSGVIQAVHVG
jgi:hypothetical protein